MKNLTMLNNTNLPDAHATILARIRAWVQSDLRFDALLGSGSLVHGGFDAYSDLDLVLVVAPRAYDEVMAERQSIAQSMGGLLAAFTGEHVGEPRLLICLYGTPLIHVDLKFIRLSDLNQAGGRPGILWARNEHEIALHMNSTDRRKSGADPQWFEDRAWIWLHYGAAKLLRGELFEAIGMLAFFRENILGPMWQRNRGLPQRGVRRIDSDSNARMALAPTVPNYEVDGVKAALMKSMLLYIELREADPPSAPTALMPQALILFIEQASAPCAGAKPPKLRL